MPITTNVVSSNSDHAEVYSIQLYVIKFVIDLLRVGGFFGYSVSSNNKTDRQEITEKVLKVTLNTIPLTQSSPFLIQDWRAAKKSNTTGVISERGTGYPSGGTVLDHDYHMYK